MPPLGERQKIVALFKPYLPLLFLGSILLLGVFFVKFFPQRLFSFSPQKEESFYSYQNSILKLSFNYPQDWKKEEGLLLKSSDLTVSRPWVYLSSPEKKREIRLRSEEPSFCWRGPEAKEKWRRAQRGQQYLGGYLGAFYQLQDLVKGEEEDLILLPRPDYCLVVYWRGEASAAARELRDQIWQSFVFSEAR